MLKIVSVLDSGFSVKAQHTIPENEFCNTSDVHRNAPEEIVISTQSHQTLRRHGSSKAAQGQYRGRVWYQETDQTQQSWIRCSD